MAQAGCFFLLLAAARPEDGDPAVVWAGGWLGWKIGLCGPSRCDMEDRLSRQQEAESGESRY